MRDHVLSLDGSGLTERPAAPARRAVRGAQAAGFDAGRFFPMGNRAELPPDQRAEDGLALCFDTGPLTERLEILGFPEVRLRVSSDRALALVAARLCDVAPDGSSTLVTRGLLNLVHRQGHERCLPLRPGEWYRVRVPMSAIAHAFPAGHRIRLALSPTYWPWAWPSPEPVTLTVDTAASRLVLPRRDPRPDGEQHTPFDAPESAVPLAVAVPPWPDDHAPGQGERVVRRDVATGVVELSVSPAYGATRLFPDGLRYEEDARDTYTIAEDAPLSARAGSAWRIRLRRDGWDVRIETASDLACDAHDFIATNELRAYEGDAEIFARRWSTRIPRDGV